jgi:hypothetical protein
MTPEKPINFTIVADGSAKHRRIYANFCAIAHTPFDVTLAFCDVLPLSEKDIRMAEADHVVRAPVKVEVVMPLQVLPDLVKVLQEHLRTMTEQRDGRPMAAGPGDPVH